MDVKDTGGMLCTSAFIETERVGGAGSAGRSHGHTMNAETFKTPAGTGYGCQSAVEGLKSLRLVSPLRSSCAFTAQTQHSIITRNKRLTGSCEV